jgi:hypothetical protein
VPGLDLVAEGGDGLGRGTDPGDACLDHAGSELRVLGQEAVAGVDGVRTGLAGGVDDFVHHQVGLGGGAAAQRIGLVSKADVQGVTVCVRVDGNGGDAFITGGADDAHRDFTAVGDQHLCEGRLCGTCGLLQIC